MREIPVKALRLDTRAYAIAYNVLLLTGKRLHEQIMGYVCLEGCRPGRVDGDLDHVALDSSSYLAVGVHGEDAQWSVTARECPFVYVAMADVVVSPATEVAVARADPAVALGTRIGG